MVLEKYPTMIPANNVARDSDWGGQIKNEHALVGWTRERCTRYIIK